MSFLTDWGLSELSPLALQRHHSLLQISNQPRTALLGHQILDLDDQSITSYTQYLGDGKDMDAFGDDFFSLCK